jgi:hypothetical protein
MIFTPIERTGELCVLLASGQADALTGRYIHVRYDDIHDLIARSDEVVEKDLQTLRFKTIRNIRAYLWVCLVSAMQTDE